MKRLLNHILWLLTLFLMSIGLALIWADPAQFGEPAAYKQGIIARGGGSFIVAVIMCVLYFVLHRVMELAETGLAFHWRRRSRHSEDRYYLIVAKGDLSKPSGTAIISCIAVCSPDSIICGDR